MIEFEDSYYEVDGMKVFNSPYNIIKKEWNWHSYIREWKGNGDGRDDVLLELFDNFTFDEVLEVRFKESGESGLLLYFDDHRFSFYRTSSTSIQVRLEVIKSILVNYLKCVIIKERGHIKYFLPNYNIEKLFVELRNILSIDIWIEEKNIRINNKKSYITLGDSFFTGIGFDGGWIYEGVYDIIENRIRFTSWPRCGLYDDGIQKDSKIGFFSGVELYKNVWMCAFDGNIENFRGVCELL